MAIKQHRIFNMKLALNLLIVILTVTACFFDIFLLYSFSLEISDTVPLTIRSRRFFVFDQEKAFGEEKRMALLTYVPVYRYSAEGIDGARDAVTEFLDVIAENSKRTRANRDAVRDYYRKQAGVALNLADVDNLIRYKDLDKLAEGILTIAETILRQLIIDDMGALKDTQRIKVMYADPRDRVIYSVRSLITAPEAHQKFEEQVAHVYWQVNESIRESLLRICQLNINANLRFDKDENRRRLAEIDGKYPTQKLHYHPGDILIPFRKSITAEDLTLLQCYQALENKELWISLPWVLLFAAMTMGLYQPVISRYIAAEFRKKPSFGMLLTILIITLLLLKAYLLFTSLPAVGFPFYLLPFLIILLNYENLAAFWTCITGALLAGLICGNQFIITVFFIFGGFTAILTFTQHTKRIHILYPSFIVGCLNALLVMVFTMYQESISTEPELSLTSIISLKTMFVNTQLFQELKFGFLGGMISGPLALIILPVLELSRYNASTFKLNHYMDLQHPIMRNLLTKTPGTYQHTMTVAYLAQSVGEEIGLNTHLLRVGAYYHDIGKTLKPNLFVENQFSGKNPHDDLDPIKSTEIIHQHVSDGVKICREAGLPNVVIDMIIQHHGTLPVEFFYNEACKSGIDVSKNEFRYSGPKPQTVEAAVLMIVDAIEAASRTLHDPNRKDIRNLVHTIISKRISDRQFDECDLTTRDIATIIQTLIDSLEASFHSRVEYPWQKEQKEKKENENRLKKSGSAKPENGNAKPESPQENG